MSPSPLGGGEVCRDWHAKTTALVATEPFVEVEQGLDTAGAARTLATHGPNQPASKAPRPVWLKFVDQFHSLLVIMLIGGALLAGVVRDITKPR